MRGIGKVVVRAPRYIGRDTEQWFVVLNPFTVTLKSVRVSSAKWIVGERLVAPYNIEHNPYETTGVVCFLSAQNSK